MGGKVIAATSVVGFLALTGAALASSSSPKPGEQYTSSFLTVTVGTPATTARVFVECLPSSGGGGQWHGTVKLTDGSFKFDKRATIDELPKGTVKGVVDVTGKFKGGEFQGAWHLGGLTCPKTSYKTTTGPGGSGG